VLVVQPDPRRDDLLEPFARLLGEVSHVKDPGLALEARRLSSELSKPDSLSPVIMDSVILLTLARSARLLAPQRSVQRPPPWLERARDLVHAHFREGLSLKRVAATADVTPWHLAREFRRHFHSSIGEYARALRLAWALEQLARDETSISAIALAAGFADQSHFTRACRSATGLAPAAYRRRKKP
jgi:AraC family transcriptional regulator